MRHNIKADIRTPSEWIGMNQNSRAFYLAHKLRELADRLESGEVAELERMDVNGNTIAVVVRG